MAEKQKPKIKLKKGKNPKTKSRLYGIYILNLLLKEATASNPLTTPVIHDILLDKYKEDIDNTTINRYLIELKKMKDYKVLGNGRQGYYIVYANEDDMKDDVVLSIWGRINQDSTIRYDMKGRILDYLLMLTQSKETSEFLLNSYMLQYEDKTATIRGKIWEDISRIINTENCRSYHPIKCKIKKPQGNGKFKQVIRKFNVYNIISRPTLDVLVGQYSDSIDNRVQTLNTLMIIDYVILDNEIFEPKQLHISNSNKFFTEEDKKKLNIENPGQFVFD